MNWSSCAKENGCSDRNVGRSELRSRLFAKIASEARSYNAIPKITALRPDLQKLGFVADVDQNRRLLLAGRVELVER